MPDVFIASAIANSGIAVLHAVEDLAAGTLKTGAIEKIGLARPDAVRLTISDSIGIDVRKKVDDLAAAIMDGRVHVSTDWNGAEFPNPS